EADAGDRELLVGVVRGVFAGVYGVESCEPKQTLYELGGDSLRAAEIAETLDEALALEVGVDLVLEALTPEALAAALLERWRAAGLGPGELSGRLASLAG